MGNSDTSDSDQIVIEADEDLEEIIPGYLLNRRKDIETILEALDKEDFEKIRIAGHSMKGSGAGYGFDAITEIGKSIEEGAINKNVDEIRRKTDELSVYLDKVRVVYAQE